MPSESRVSALWRMVFQSDWLPMMSATGAVIQSILSGIQKHRPDYRIGLGFGKAWQRVGNGLSCLGESRQASFKGGHEEENQDAQDQGARRGGCQPPQKGRGGAQGRAGVSFSTRGRAR